MTYCNLLFRMEQEIADKTTEERYEERLKQAKPVFRRDVCVGKFQNCRAQVCFG